MSASFAREQQFDYENGVYLTAPVNRISKVATHLELFRRVSHLAGDIMECGVFKGVSLSCLIKFRVLFENAFSKKSWHSTRSVDFRTLSSNQTFHDDRNSSKRREIRVSRRMN